MTRALLVLALITGTARADEFASSPARAGYRAAQRRLLDSAGRAAGEAAGVRIDGAYAFEAFVAPQLDDRLVSAGLAVLETELDLAQLANAHLGAVHIAGFAIHGTGVTEELGDIHGVSGNSAPSDVRLFEAWYEQPIGAGTLRAGLLAADQEFVLADHSTTLLGATFGITSQFSANVLGPVYPVAAPGVSGRLALSSIVARAAVYDGTQMSSHGVPTALGPAHLVIGEIQLANVLKLGAWHHSDRGDAIYAVADALVAPQLGAFSRAGYSPDGPVELYWDAGLRVVPGAKRPDDFVCLGLAFARVAGGDQTVFEASYEAQIRWLTLQPDLQVILMRERSVAVFATRVTVVF